MALPLITSTQVTEWLKAKKLGVEIFDEFPTDMKNVRNGIYINDPASSDKSPYRLGINLGGNIYTVTDSMRIILVTFQGDKKRDKCVESIQQLVEDNVLMNGYHERDYAMSQDYLNRAEYRTYDFNLKRIEIQ